MRLFAGGERMQGMTEGFEQTERNRFAATRAEALAQWQAFLPQLGRYAAVRNQVVAGHVNVSRLSPAVRQRLITEDELVAATLQRYAFAGVEKWLQEVCWRRYWKGWLERRPGVWADWKKRLAEQHQHGAAGLWRRAEQVMAGRSGVAVMDRFAHELVETGYLANHARMWWASFWIHVERLPWEIGAGFFFRHLLDADPASNTLSWRWVAGLQTPGKTYLVRRSNLEKYLDAIPDASGLERLEDSRVSARQGEDSADLTVVAPPPATAALDSGGTALRRGLWLHEEDLSVELSAELGGLRPVAVTAARVAPRGEGWQASPVQAAHRAAALADACGRAEQHYGVAVERVTVPDLAAHLRQWAERAGLAEVVAMRPSVGLVADEVGTLQQVLGAAGVALRWVDRASDAQIWPLAQRGFFPFWEKLRRQLQDGKV
jgi:deoxyribodipyrimidine photo-lyase